MTMVCRAKPFLLLLVGVWMGGTGCNHESGAPNKYGLDASSQGGNDQKADASNAGGTPSSGGNVSSGGSVSNGGSVSSRGGSSGSVGGSPAGVGGASNKGGASSTTGGSAAGSGGSPNGSGGSSSPGGNAGGSSGKGGTAAGGSSVSSGGTTGSSGGTTGTGGNTGGSSALSDGCSNDLARNLTLQQIAVYQSVKIPVMKDGAEVAAASRNGSVVQGHDAMFRVFVTLGSGWTARDLSARLTLTPAGGQPTQLFSKKTISASSVDADPKTSFQILVPASAMAASLRYSVQVVECSAQSGTAGQAQFPSTGDIDLSVKTTGGLKVKIIPIQVGTFLPDTSTTGLAGYTAELAAMYPVNNVSLTVGDTVTTTSPVDWTAMLDQIRAKRSTDKPAADVYYFGLVKPADTLRTYCQSSCTTGIGYVVTSATGASSRAAVGIGFGDKASFDTMAHELGHNHGRNHSPCSTAGTISGVDANYPYSKGALGSWGYDTRTQTLLDPTKSTDIMSYCSNQWMSDYTYLGVTTRVAAVNGATMVYTPADELSRWRVLLVDERGPRWGIPIDDEAGAEGVPETATIYDATGAAMTSVTVYRTEIGDSSASMVMVPEPQPSWYAVAVAGTQPVPFAAATR